MTENEMTNQAAQTMPELPASRGYLHLHNTGGVSQVYGYTADQMRAMYQQGYAAALSQTAGVADGWVLVPARMELTPENMETLVFMLGGDPEAKDADERWNGGTLWVGETIGDHGEKYYGLNVANVECYEEGSVPIVEFAAAPAASGGEPPSAASVSERARVSLDLNNLPAEWPWDEGSPCLDPRPVGMVYPAVPTPRAFGYLDKTGVEWAAYDTGQMEEYGRRAFADGANTAIRALEQALTQQREGCEALWCLHVLGPDDVHAAPSRAHAEKAAERLNAFMASRNDRHPLGPECQAVAAPWPHSPESHAESVEKFIKEWLMPATPQPSADAVRELVAKWRGIAETNFAQDRLDKAIEISMDNTLRDCADELESLLSAASGEKGVGNG